MLTFIALLGRGDPVRAVRPVEVQLGGPEQRAVHGHVPAPALPGVHAVHRHHPRPGTD